MSQIITPHGAPYDPPPPPEKDKFYYGWRYVTRTLPDGTETVEEVPLTLEDRLFPEEGDQHLDTPLHRRDREYCGLSLASQYEGDRTVAVLWDQRIDFNVAGIRPMGPDVVVVLGVEVPQDPTAGTYLIAENGGRATLAIELGSPKTRRLDLRRKPELFFRIGLEKYVFVDRGPRGNRPAQLNCYRRGRRDWVRMTPDASERYDLSPVGVLIGLEDERVWLYDAKTGERIMDHSETVLARLASEAKAKDAEAKARKAAEKAKRAETRAKKSAANAVKEARARADAEAKAREEAERNAALEERVRELEAQLRRQQRTE
jgi:colicin import membrane protein